MARTQVRGASSTVAYFSADEPDTIFAVACRHDGDTRGSAFCSSIVGHTSMEFMDVFAYETADCVHRHGRVYSQRVGAERSGLVRHPQHLQFMQGRLGPTRVTVRAIERGFEVTFDR